MPFPFTPSLNFLTVVSSLISNGIPSQYPTALTTKSFSACLLFVLGFPSSLFVLERRLRECGLSVNMSTRCILAWLKPGKAWINCIDGVSIHLGCAYFTKSFFYRSFALFLNKYSQIGQNVKSRSWLKINRLFCDQPGEVFHVDASAPEFIQYKRRW